MEHKKGMVHLQISTRNQSVSHEQGFEILFKKFNLYMENIWLFYLENENNINTVRDTFCTKYQYQI